MDNQIHFAKPPVMLLILNIIFAAVYYSWWFNFSNISNPILYGLLFLGETYHVLMSFLFWITVWPNKKFDIKKYSLGNYSPSVDIYIPVTGEPADIVQKTITFAKNIEYKNKKIYILNDGYVAKKDNWKEIISVAQSLHVHCITRKNPGGAKAGNINNALHQTTGDIIVIFDADMTPSPSFLQKTIPYFQDTKVGFVQTPQYYRNAEFSTVTQGSWEQQELFFGPIMVGKDNYNSAFICGTNVAIRREALEQVGGMEEENIAEDIITSLKIHAKGWRSIYVADVLATGLAPLDLVSYYKQQKRWARGSLEILLRENLFFKKGLTWDQKREYLACALYYCNGIIVLIDICVPFFYLFFGVAPVHISTMTFALFFIPFMFLNLLTLYIVSANNITFTALAFSQSSFALQISALWSAITGEKTTFAVTSKSKTNTNSFPIVYPHVIYVVLVICSIIIGVYREGPTASVATNVAWEIFNICMFFPFIRSAFQSSLHKSFFWNGEFFKKRYSL